MLLDFVLWSRKGAKSLVTKRKRRSRAGRSRACTVGHERTISSLNSNSTVIDELRSVYVEFRRGFISARDAQVCVALLRELRAGVNDDKILTEFRQEFEMFKRTMNGNPMGARS